MNRPLIACLTAIAVLPLVGCNNQKTTINFIDNGTTYRPEVVRYPQTNDKPKVTATPAVAEPESTSIESGGVLVERHYDERTALVVSSKPATEATRTITRTEEIPAATTTPRPSASHPTAPIAEGTVRNRRVTVERSISDAAPLVAPSATRVGTTKVTIERHVSAPEIVIE